MFRSPTLVLALALALLFAGCGDDGGADGDDDYATYRIPASAQEAILKAHNDERKNNTDGSVPPLSWDAAPELVALKYAAKLKADGTCTLIHNKDRGFFGENLWMMGMSSGLTYSDFTPAMAAGAVALWIAEKSDYDYATNFCPADKMCGHYTQVVWKSTRTVGCALLACQGKYPSLILICDYAPPGNYVGQRPF